MKIYFIILDGAADRKIQQLDWKTPLQCAKTPGLDSLARMGSQSMITIIDDNIAPESDSGTMALLSYDPKIYYPGRGTLEGLGAGMMENYRYRVSFRINFASYDAQKQLLDRRTARGLNDEELQKFANDLQSGIELDDHDMVKIGLKAFGHHRGILTLASDVIELSGNVTNTDPGFKKEGCFSIPVSDFIMQPRICSPLDDTQRAKITAHYVNEFVRQAREILDNSEINRDRIRNGVLPANCILVRDGGNVPKMLPSFEKKYGWSLILYGQLPSEKAIADLIGADFHYTKALELQLDGKYLQKVAHDLVECNQDVKYVHLKGPDEPGHDHDPQGKIDAIERIDYFFINELIKGLADDDIVIVTCDHATPCELGIHSCDKVPLLICGKGIPMDKQTKFSEKNASLGGCKVVRAIDILQFIHELYILK